jgi:hypothetical protein
MDNKYTNIDNEYFAKSLAFIGFRFFKFKDKEGNTIYTFENTEEFKGALAKLIKLKKEYRK